MDFVNRFSPVSPVFSQQIIRGSNPPNREPPMANSNGSNGSNEHGDLSEINMVSGTHWFNMVQ